MKEIFVNLKRFDVPKEMGGVCPMKSPGEWIQWVVSESVRNGLGKLKEMEVVFLLPEALIISALEKLAAHPAEDTQTIKIGCQGIYREDVREGGNFGAFTTNRPAAAAKNLGCTWAIIGHSEEIKDKSEIMAVFDPEILHNDEKRSKGKKAINSIINQEVLCALRAGMNVLLCAGETAEERGQGTPEEQKTRVKQVLRNQLVGLLEGFSGESPENRVVLAYEPIWAIGPGKTPPDPEYISFVASFLKELSRELYGVDMPVVYGGGLKEENAGAIAKLEAMDGGLVALTKFTGEIGFYPDDLKKIIEKYVTVQY